MKTQNKPNGRQCSVKGCERSDIHGHDLCSKHYRREYIHGAPDVLLKAPNGSGTQQFGYKLIYVAGKQMREHRHVMEKWLGRRLRRY